LIPVHVVSGFLGAGKTTLLINQLAARAGQERCAIVVNDFGVASLDASLLAQHAPVREIPGGCICCTAPEGLVPALSQLIAEQAPDRIFIETTGLARPADVVDTLMRSGLTRIKLAPTIVVVDPARFVGNAPPLLRQQAAAADVLVMNRLDLCSESAKSELQAWAEARYPPLAGIYPADHGALPVDALEAEVVKGFRIFSPKTEAASTEDYVVESRVWSAERVFDMGTLKRAVTEAGLERFKGIFRTDIGWYLFQWASNHLEVSPTAIRSGSRADLIGEEQQRIDSLIEVIDQAVYVQKEDPENASLALIDPGGWEIELTRAALAALPEQVADVAALVPGREGSGVMLSEVLALSGASKDVAFVVVASDGMTTEPVAIAAAQSAILVHSYDEAAYPAEKGGPFRIFVPPSDGKTACANVKKVVRIVVGAPA